MTARQTGFGLALLVAGGVSAAAFGQAEPTHVELPAETFVERHPRPEERAPPLDNRCLSEDEIARYRSVLALKNDPTAFRPSAIWLPPFFMTDAERSYSWAALLYFQSLDFDERTRTRVVPPFFVSHCAPESTTLLTPFYSYRTDAEGTASLYFTYFRRRDRLVETDVFFPFAWSTRERKSAEEPWVGTGAFLPFAFWKRDPNGAHFTLVPPLFWRWGDEQETTTLAANVFWHETKLRTDLGIVPLYFRGRGVRDGDYDISPPLFWSFRDEGKHSLFLPPLLTYFHSHPDGFSLTSFPLLFAGRDGKDRHVVVPPLFWMWGDDAETTVVGANVFWHKTQQRSDLGVVPLYFRGRSETGEDYDVSPLLFWSYRDGRKHSLLLPPLLTWHGGDGETETTWAVNTFVQTRPDGFTLNFVPLLFAGKEGESHHVVVPPLFARWGDGEETTTLAANVFWHEAKTRLDWGIVPLYFHGRTASTVYDVSPLLFWSFRDGPRHSLLLPALLTWHHDDGETSSTWAISTFFQTRPYGYTLASIPFLFMGRDGDAHHTVVPPLFWRWGDNDETTTIAGPVYWHGAQRRLHFGVAPLYFAGRSTAGDYDVSPLLFWSFRQTLRHRLFIPPLLAFHEGDGETETTWALNTIYQSRPNGFTLNSIPFLFAGREGDDFHVAVPPIFFRWGDSQTTTTIAGPLFVRSTAERTDAGLIPLYFHGPGYDVSPFLFWSLRDEDEHTVVIPPLLTFYRSRPSGFSLMSFPLLWAGRDEDTHHTFLLPAFERWGDKDETTTIAANVYFHQTQQRWDFGLIPLFFSGRGPKGDYDVSPLLFWSLRDGPRKTLLVPPLLTYYETDGETETAWVLNTYFATRPYGFTLNAFPFLFAGQDGDAFHTVLPPLFWNWGDKVEQTTIAGPLFWHSAPLKFNFGLAPLYFMGRAPDGDYDISPPLFWSYREGRKWSLLLPAALTYVGSDGADTQTVWSINTYFQSRPNGYTFSFFPLLFTGEEGAKHHTFIPPLFWRWGDRDEKTTLVGNVFWHGSPDRFDLGIVPLFFHGSSVRGGDYDISPPLFWSFRDEGKHSLLIPPLLAFYQSRPTGFTLASFPLLFVGREGSEHHTIVPPLFWRWGDASTTTTVVGTFFTRSTATGSTFGLAPLYFGGRHGETSWDLVPPLFFRSATGDTQHLTLPPFFDYHSTGDSRLFLSPLAVYSKEPGYERTVVGGLYWNMTGPEEEARVVAPFWWDFKSKKKGTRISTVFPLYWRYERPEEVTHLFLNLMYSYGHTELGPSWSFHLFPLFDLASYHPKHFLWQVFAGLFGRETQAQSQRWRVAWVWTDPTPVTGTSH